MKIDTTQRVLQLKAKLFADLNVPVVPLNEPWNSVVEKLKNHPDHIVHVVDASNRLTGIITDQDVLDARANVQLAPLINNGTATAKDVMKPIDPNHTDSVAQSSEPLEQVIAKLQGDNKEKRPFKALPLVNDDGTIVGQITRDSIQKDLDDLLKT